MTPTEIKEINKKDKLSTFIFLLLKSFKVFLIKKKRFPTRNGR